MMARVLPTATIRRSRSSISFPDCASSRRLVEGSRKIGRRVMEENRCRRLAVAQRRTVMRQAGSAIGEAVSQCLVNGHGASWSIQPDGPWRRKGGLWRKVETQGDAEFALFPV